MHTKTPDCSVFIRNAVGVISIGLLALLWIPFPSFAQEPLLQITSPTSGTVVNPGQTLSISITSPAGATFSQVDVVGGDPIGASDIATAVPTQISLTIPTDIPEGQYVLIAEGTTSSGQDAESAPITIDVERTDLPVGLTTLVSEVVFDKAGQTMPFIILAEFNDGTELDVTRSSNLAFLSSVTSVATIDANGIATGVCAGTSTLTATYTVGGSSVQVSIPAQGPQSLIASPSLLNFNNQDVGITSSAQTITLVNATGAVINVLNLAASGDFSQVSPCVGSLQPGTTCTVSVTFSPTATGIRSGTLSITDDACQSALQVPLTGTGTSDFSVAATPASQTVTVGQSTSYSVSVASLGGFSSAVGLSVAGLPSGATATFSPTSISGGSGSSIVTVKTSSKSTPIGTSTLTISGAGGGLAHSISVTLTVNGKQ